MKYRKKPIEVEAMQWLGNYDEMKAFVGDKIYGTWDNKLTLRHRNSATLEVYLNAWVIKESNGEMYSCSDHIFRETYELV